MEDEVSPINGTMTVSPSGSPSFVDGVATFNSLVFSDAHQIVRIQATGTINGEVIEGISDPITIIPNSENLVIADDNDFLISDALERIGVDYDLYQGWDVGGYDPLPETILEDYERLFAHRFARKDTLAIKYYLNSGSEESKKSIALFTPLCGLFYSSNNPYIGTLVANFGIDMLSIYPNGEIDPNEDDYFQGISDDIIGNGLTVDCNENATAWRNRLLSPLSDSTNVRIVFETTMFDEDDSYLAPIGIRHNGIKYKTFAAGFFLDFFGTDADKDTLITRLISWFESDEIENYGHTPGFANSLTDEPDDFYEIDYLAEFEYVATFSDLDEDDVLSAEPLVIPTWIDYTVSDENITLTGIPQVSDIGDTLLVLKVFDDEGNFNLQSTRIRVNNVNYAPVADDIEVTNGMNTSVEITLTGSDADGDELTFEISSLPMNGSLPGDPPNLTYTPNTDWTGIDSFTYKANDGELDSELATVTITVSENVAPLNVQIVVTIDDVGNVVSTLTWDEVTGADFYNVYACDIPNGEFVQINDSPITEITFESIGSSAMKFFQVTSNNGVTLLSQ